MNREYNMMENLYRMADIVSSNKKKTRREKSARYIKNIESSMFGLLKKAERRTSIEKVPDIMLYEKENLSYKCSVIFMRICS